MEHSFICLCTNQRPFETVTDTIELPDRPAPLREDANLAQTGEHDAQTQVRATAVQEDESCKHQIWCYLAMKLDASSLMLILHDCMNSKCLGDGRKAWQLLQQRFRCNETTTVRSLMRQLARLTTFTTEDKVIHQYFIRAQELVTRLHHAGEELSAGFKWSSTTIRVFLWCRRASILQRIL